MDDTEEKDIEDNLNGNLSKEAQLEQELDGNVSKEAQLEKELDGNVSKEAELEQDLGGKVSKEAQLQKELGVRVSKEAQLQEELEPKSSKPDSDEDKNQEQPPQRIYSRPIPIIIITSAEDEDQVQQGTEESKEGSVEPKQDERKPETEEPELESDFILIRKENDDFLQPDLETKNIPSESEFTVLTDYDQAVAERNKIREQIDVVPIFQSDEEIRRVSGDFTALPSVRMLSKTSIVTYQTEKSESEFEVPVTVPTTEPTLPVEVLNREPYYETYDRTNTEMVTLKIRNNFLQRKMAEYFRKRKMEHVLKEADQHVDTQQKYFKRLDKLSALLQFDEKRRLALTEEVNELRIERDKKLEFVNKAMKQLMDRERDISAGLIHTKTGKEIPEKIIERLLRRQNMAVEQVAQHRLKYIKIANRVMEKQAALQAVDKLGDNLRLVDYEQLSIENRGYEDKVEEREEELAKLRRKSDCIYQVLAHFREKSAAATLDIMAEQNVLHSVEIEFMEARERTNYFKVQRDTYRGMINKIREESGILFKPKLLRDLENATHEVENIENALNDVKEQQRTQLFQLRAIRKNIEGTSSLKVVADKIHIPRILSSKVNTLRDMEKRKQNGSDFKIID